MRYRSEIVIALSCAVGTDIISVCQVLREEFAEYQYNSHVIKISKEILEENEPSIKNFGGYQRADRLMDLGNDMRKSTADNAILARGVIHQIRQYRRNINEKEGLKPVQATAYIIDSLKHPDEVKLLREVYGSGFYLFAINESEDFRAENLINSKNMGKQDAERLIERDLEEAEKYGQKTRRVFELADFHLSLNKWKKALPKTKDKGSKPTQTEISEAKQKIVRPQMNRILQLLFSNPFITPTFDEYAMFMAYSSGLRSADLSRQVGAVISTPTREIIAMGANDCPSFGGGQYWPEYNPATFSYEDAPKGRDYMRGYDSNKQACVRITNEIVDIFDFPEDEEGKKKKNEAKNRIYNSKLKSLTEYGRPVHAEMAAILSCARTGISLRNATLYCSTFPCHNCAKHIIGAGIKRVVYIEPYPKSKSLEFYDDSMVLQQTVTDETEVEKVSFEEFVGIGPRRFYDLFSLNLSVGYSLERKQRNNELGKKVDWAPKTANLRCDMQPSSYLEREDYRATEYLTNYKNIKGEGNKETSKDEL